MLGVREPDKYGKENSNQIQQLCFQSCKKCNLKMEFFQSNSEAEIVEKIHEAKNKATAILINAAAYTHTSVGIGDAIKAIDTKVIEVHISNTFSREEYRHNSYLSPVVDGIIIGFGLKSYELAIESFLPRDE